MMTDNRSSQVFCFRKQVKRVLTRMTSAVSSPRTSNSNEIAVLSSPGEPVIGLTIVESNETSIGARIVRPDKLDLDKIE